MENQDIKKEFTKYELGKYKEIEGHILNLNLFVERYEEYKRNKEEEYASMKKEDYLMLLSDTNNLYSELVEFFQYPNAILKEQNKIIKYFEENKSSIDYKEDIVLIQNKKLKQSILLVDKLKEKINTKAFFEFPKQFKWIRKEIVLDILKKVEENNKIEDIDVSSRKIERIYALDTYKYVAQKDVKLVLNDILYEKIEINENEKENIKREIKNSAFNKNKESSFAPFSMLESSIKFRCSFDENRDETFVPELVKKEYVPEFQRNNDKWSEDMKIKFVENILRGFRTSIKLFSIPDDNIFKETPGMILDGLQRLTAIQDFMQNKIRIFKELTSNDKGLSYSDIYNDKELNSQLFKGASVGIEFEVYRFDNMIEAVEFYIEINEYISHSSEDIKKAKDYLEKLKKEKMVEMIKKENFVKQK
jgi:hypothetical protein